MSATTCIVESYRYRVPIEWFGGFEADYDRPAINGEVLDALNAALPDGCVLTVCGAVYGPATASREAIVGLLDDARDTVDLTAVAQAHPAPQPIPAGVLGQAITRAVRDLMAAHNISVAEYCRRCDLPTATVRRHLTNGKFTFGELLDLSELTNTSPADLIHRAEQIAREPASA